MGENLWLSDLRMADCSEWTKGQLQWQWLLPQCFDALSLTEWRDGSAAKGVCLQA